MQNTHWLVSYVFTVNFAFRFIISLMQFLKLKKAGNSPRKSGLIEENIPLKDMAVDAQSTTSLVEVVTEDEKIRETHRTLCVKAKKACSNQVTLVLLCGLSLIFLGLCLKVLSERQEKRVPTSEIYGSAGAYMFCYPARNDSYAPVVTDVHEGVSGIEIEQFMESSADVMLFCKHGVLFKKSSLELLDQKNAAIRVMNTNGVEDVSVSLRVIKEVLNSYADGDLPLCGAITMDEVQSFCSEEGYIEFPRNFKSSFVCNTTAKVNCLDVVIEDTDVDNNDNDRFLRILANFTSLFLVLFLIAFLFFECYVCYVNCCGEKGTKDDKFTDRSMAISYIIL